MSVLLLFLFSYFSLFAQWNQVKSLEVKFKIKNFGRYTYGTFSRTEANIFFDENDLEKSFFQGSVIANSIHTKNEKRDLHLKEKEAFFNTIKYPRINIKSMSIQKVNPTEYRVAWSLTMKGVAKKTESVVYIQYENGKINFKTQLDINRLMWEVGENSFLMSDHVFVDIFLIADK